MATERKPKWLQEWLRAQKEGLGDSGDAVQGLCTLGTQTHSLVHNGIGLFCSALGLLQLRMQQACSFRSSKHSTSNTGQSFYSAHGVDSGCVICHWCSVCPITHEDLSLSPSTLVKKLSVAGAETGLLGTQWPESPA